MRNVILTSIISTGVVVCLVAVGIGAEKTKFLEFKTIAKGCSSGITDSQNLVIKDTLTWKEIWNAHTKIRLPQPALLDIDFAEEMVIAVFKGECPTGGYTIEIDTVEKVIDEVIVHIAETKPGFGTIVTQALTQPYHIIQIEKTTLPVEFIYTEEETE